MELLAVTVTFVDSVDVAALPVQEPDDPETSPVTFPVKAPANPVAVSTPEEELKVRFVPVFGGRLPVAPVTNVGKHSTSEDSSATVTFVAVVAVVAVAEFPVY